MPTPQPDRSTTEPAHARLVHLIELAYEAACDAADRDLIDFSLIGEPLRDALAIVRDWSEVAA